MLFKVIFFHLSSLFFILSVCRANSQQANLPAKPITTTCLPKYCPKPSGRPLIVKRIELNNNPNLFSSFNGQSDNRGVGQSAKFYSLQVSNDGLKIRPYGYIKYEVYGDSRQVVGSGNDQLLLFPEPVFLSKDGKDINDHAQLGMSVYETRAGLEIIGPKFCDVTTRGLIEIDFRGINETAIVTGLPESRSEISLGGLRVRLAYIQFKWKNYELITGYDWHPLVVLDCYAHTVSYNRGFPFDPGARNPQVRLTYKPKHFELAFTAASQLQFESPGPVGFTEKYIRDAIVPNLNFRTIYNFPNWQDTIIGFSADYKRLVPRLFTDKCFATTTGVNSGIFEVFGAIIKPPWSARAKLVWAQNAADQGLISGYGVSKIVPQTDCHEYTPTAAFAAWLDFSYLFWCDQMELGFFSGYTKNLGSSNTLAIKPETNKPILFGLTEQTKCIDYVSRFAPRWVYAWDDVRFGLELEWTRAAFGRFNRCAQVKKSLPVDNIRLISAIFYIF